MNIEKPITDCNKSEVSIDVPKKMQLDNSRWTKINWTDAIEDVNRLQTRISKATLNKDYRKVKKLQYLLINNFYAKAIAVKKICELDEEKTISGIDHKVYITAKDKFDLLNRLSPQKYSSKPTKIIYRIDGSPFNAANIYDRCIQYLWKMAVEPVQYAISDKRSFAFKKGYTQNNVRLYMSSMFSKKNNAKWLLHLKFKNYFNEKSFEWLRKNVVMDKKILNEFIKAGYLDETIFYKREFETQQGGNIAEVLSNYLLDGLENFIEEKYMFNPATGNKCKKGLSQNKVNIVRYRNEMIISGATSTQCNGYINIISSFIDDRGVEIDLENTKVISIYDGFDFISWNYRKDKHEVYTSQPSKESYKNVCKKCKDIIDKNRAVSTDVLISKLNPVIYKWCNYHKYASSSKWYSKFENELFHKTWTWCKRRHSNKNRTYIANKYYKRVGNFKWTLYGEKMTLSHPAEWRIKNSKRKKNGLNWFLPTDRLEIAKASKI